jgi:tetraacyldisaccharide-1-P 4'-kinase
MIAQNCPWAIVAVGPDRHRLGKWVLEQSFCDFFILDDGYQHMSLYRDLDVLLFDSMDINGLSGVLPSGRLREPLEGTKGAGAFVFTRANSLSSIQPVQRRIEESLGLEIGAQAGSASCNRKSQTIGILIGDPTPGREWDRESAIVL